MKENSIDKFVIFGDVSFKASKVMCITKHKDDLIVVTLDAGNGESINLYVKSTVRTITKAVNLALEPY